MRPRQRLRTGFAAWLGIVALAIQALIPALLAAEIDIAGKQKGASVFTLCAFGHVHLAAKQDEQHGKNAPADHDLGAPCPICIALMASPAFTAPLQIALPLPQGRAVAALTAGDGETLFRIAATAYRSRAPPLG